MTGLFTIIKRNCKLFFKDKGMFFTALITPLILLVLYATFLAKVYKDAFLSTFTEGIQIEDKLINGLVGGQLVSSLLAVCAVTVAFCSNLLMVQDKVSGARRDLDMTPASSSLLAVGYFVASAAATMIISVTALAAGLIYLALTGWYLAFSDVLLLLVDVTILVLFGTALSSIISCNLSTSGQASAVGSIVSSCYGFICGAYMPISSFGEGLQKVIAFLPGTYGTSLLRNHALGGVYKEMEALNLPTEVIDSLKDSVDCNLYFFDTKVSLPIMFVILGGATLLTLLGYILICKLRKQK